MSITSIVRKLFFSSRQNIILPRYTKDVEEVQQRLLLHLIDRGNDTEYGKNISFNNIHSYEDFSQTVPINT